MALRVIRAGRRATGDVSTYIGETGTVFYDESTGLLRLSNGVTPGGINNVIPVATASQVGGIKAGPGANISASGVLTIDTTGLPLSFGDFSSTTADGPSGTTAAYLSSVNDDEDIVFESNGTGSVSVVGEFNVFPTDGGPIDSRNPVFTVKSDGQVNILVPDADSTEGAVSIIGGLDGIYQSPLNTGVMLHVTGIAGTPGVPSRIYNDAQNSFAAFVARRYNNTAVSPAVVLDGEEIMRLSGTSHNGTSIPGTANQRIVFKALGNQTVSNQGGSIELWTTPLNSNTLTKVATIDNANGFTVTKATITGNANVGNIGTTGVFVGNLTGNASGSAATVTTAAQPNITSTGTLSSLTVSGNANTGNLGTTTIIATTANLTAINGGLMQNGNSNVTITANSNITLTATSNATAVITSTGANVAGYVTATGMVTANNYSGGIRNVGTLGAAGTVTIDFATDHMILVNLTTTATIAFANITAGKTVTVVIKNATGSNRVITAGVNSSNTSGGDATPTVTNGHSGVFVYRTFGTATTDIYCEVN